MTREHAEIFDVIILPNAHYSPAIASASVTKETAIIHHRKRDIATKSCVTPTLLMLQHFSL